MTTSTHETQIEVDPKVPLVRITREFDAPAAAVFRAHADPDLFKRWIGPRDHEVEVDGFDFRTGGSFRYLNLYEGEEYAFRGCFHEVRDGALIVQTFTYEGMPDGVALERLEFEDIGDGRSRITTTSLVDSFEGRDGFIASGMEQGVVEGYEQLDEVLAAG